jgi:hypothetical protein
VISTFFTRDPIVEFRALLARQGWTVTHAETFETDGRIAKPVAGPRQAAHVFHPHLMDNTTRKVLRILLLDRASREDLLHVCSNEKRIDDILARLEEDGLIAQAGANWGKSAACGHIHDIGATLEWVVAEWFRSQLLSPALHGVTIKEVPHGGDLDVVAVVNDLRVWVECKAVNARHGVSKPDLRRFLQRAHDFNPEVAILLVDTDAQIDATIQALNYICAEMDRALGQAAGLSQSGTASPQATFQARRTNELWWGGANRFVTTVRRSIDTSLKAVLRLYHSDIRHYVYPYGGSPTYAYDFVAGTVTQLT